LRDREAGLGFPVRSILRDLKTGEHLVPEAALEALAGQDIHFMVRGKATYEQQVAAIRGAASPLGRLVVDVPDTSANRQWMRQFKATWKERLEQLELWMVSYPIDID